LLDVRAEARTLQHTFITLGGPKAHDHFGEPDAIRDGFPNLLRSRRPEIARLMQTGNGS
jgi:hypothetical protein